MTPAETPCPFCRKPLRAFGCNEDHMWNGSTVCPHCGSLIMFELGVARMTTKEEADLLMRQPPIRRAVATVMARKDII